MQKRIAIALCLSWIASTQAKTPDLDLKLLFTEFSKTCLSPLQRGEIPSLKALSSFSSKPMPYAEDITVERGIGSQGLSYLVRFTDSADLDTRSCGITILLPKDEDELNNFKQSLTTEFKNWIDQPEIASNFQKPFLCKVPQFGAESYRVDSLDDNSRQRKMGILLSFAREKPFAKEKGRFFVAGLSASDTGSKVKNKDLCQ